MRLSNAQVRDVLHQMDDTTVVAPENPAVPQLESAFGPHTFFVGQDGLHVVERGKLPEPTREAAFVVKIADWVDGSHTRLTPSRPEVAKAVDIGPRLGDLPVDDDGDAQDLFAGHGNGKAR